MSQKRKLELQNFCGILGVVRSAQVVAAALRVINVSHQYSFHHSFHSMLMPRTDAFLAVILWSGVVFSLFHFSLGIICMTLLYIWCTSLTLSAPNCLKQTLPCSNSGDSIFMLQDIWNIFIIHGQTVQISGETARYELTHLNLHCLQKVQHCLWRCMSKTIILSAINFTQMSFFHFLYDR